MGQSSSVNPRNVLLSGYCDYRYIPVRNHLKNQLLKGEERNVQLCVYVNGKCVIDLYGTSTGDLDFNREKLQVSKIQSTNSKIHFKIQKCHRQFMDQANPSNPSS